MIRMNYKQKREWVLHIQSVGFRFVTVKYTYRDNPMEYHIDKVKNKKEAKTIFEEWYYNAYKERITDKHYRVTN